MKLKFDVDHEGDLYFWCNECLKYSRDFEPHYELDIGRNKIIYNEELKDDFIIRCYWCGARYQLLNYDSQDPELSQWKRINKDESDVTE